MWSKFKSNQVIHIRIGLIALVFVLLGSLLFVAGDSEKTRLGTRPYSEGALSGVTIPPTTTTTIPPTTVPVKRTVVTRANRGHSTRAIQPYNGDLSALVDRLAMCESGMNPRTNTGNGFYGAFQFMLRTWQRFRPGNPIDYSYAEQKAVIMQYFPVSSWRTQFPACSRKLGVA